MISLKKIRKKKCCKDGLCSRVITDILSFLSQRTLHILNIMTSLVDAKYMYINTLK